MKIRNRNAIKVYFHYHLVLNDFLTGIPGTIQTESQSESVILGGYFRRLTQVNGEDSQVKIIQTNIPFKPRLF